MSSQSFLKGTFVLAISNLVVKILGSIFRIPLGNLIESDGIGYYQTAYPLFVAVLAISTSGMPTAISKMVAERIKLKRYKTAHKIFRISFIMLSTMGVLSFLIFFFGAGFLADMLKDKNAYYSIKALSLALLIVPCVNAFRGYFQGRGNMVPTSFSQISEQFVRVFMGLFLAYILLPKGKAMSAAGAAFGPAFRGMNRVGETKPAGRRPTMSARSRSCIAPAKISLALALLSFTSTMSGSWRRRPSRGLLKSSRG